MIYNEILGFTCFILIGMSLGLLGGGGSIFTLPTLVYVLGISPLISSTYSLFIVGIISMTGAIHYIRKRQVHYLSAILFAIPALIFVSITRHYLKTSSIQIDYHPGIFLKNQNFLIMLLFAGLIIWAGFSMITRNKNKEFYHQRPLIQRYGMLSISGAIIGALTGVVGIGGGFLIVPVLVLLINLPMNIAVGTSLIIIALKSLIGFVIDLKAVDIDWSFLIFFSLMGIIGIGLGTYLSPHIEEIRLKKYVGWFMLCLGISILFKEIFLQSHSIQQI
ncbi:MAG: sulfite exporter TauE/SafE family protein [Saprospiraceae bacterium]